MPLSLLAGPANAGKVALLLERYLDALDSDPILIVPNRPDVDRAERELLTRAGALVGGSIGTFDDLFERIAQGNGSHRPVISQAQRTLLLRRVVAGAEGRSARFSGFADSLGSTVAELESALLEPGELDGELADALRRLPRGARPARALGPRARAPPRRRARRRRPRRLGAAAGVRLRLRGPDRRRVGAARGARRARRGDRLAAVRARPRRLRFAYAHGRGPHAPGGGPDRGAAAEPRSALAGARPPGALVLQRGAPRRDPSWTARCASSRAPASAARSSSSRTRSSRCCATALRRTRSRSSARRSTAGAPRSTRPSRRSACPTRSRAGCGSARRRSARRCSRCCATPGSTASGATCSRSSARRTRGSRGTTSTSSKAGCAGAA